MQGDAMFRILSISGGGFLGLMPAALLAGIEAGDRQTGGVPVGRHFDLIAGTSIGGLIALGLACDVPAARIVDGFVEHGPRIFPPSSSGLWSARSMFRLLRRARHDGTALRAAIESFVDPGMRMADLGREVLVPLIRISDGQPVLVMRASHPHWKVADVAMAAAAAPTYFPAVRLEGAFHCDGAPFANAPDLLALHMACREFGRQDADIGMLSLGTMTARFDLPDPPDGDLGLIGWLRGERILRTFLSTQQMMAGTIMQDRIGSRYLRIDAGSHAVPDPRSPEIPVSSRQPVGFGLDEATPAATRALLRMAEDLGHRHGDRIDLMLQDPAPAGMDDVPTCDSW